MVFQELVVIQGQADGATLTPVCICLFLDSHFKAFQTIPQVL
jgi:hypothetical protein